MEFLRIDVYNTSVVYTTLAKRSIPLNSYLPLRHLESLFQGPELQPKPKIQ
jgi:hypothetical protein